MKPIPTHPTPLPNSHPTGMAPASPFLPFGNATPATFDDPLGPDATPNPPQTDKSKHVLDLVISIFSTILCCFPTGLIAIVLSIIALVRYNNGSYMVAASTGKAARILWIISVVLGLILIAVMVFWGDELKDYQP